MNHCSNKILEGVILLAHKNLPLKLEHSSAKCTHSWSLQRSVSRDLGNKTFLFWRVIARKPNGLANSLSFRTSRGKWLLGSKIKKNKKKFKTQAKAITLHLFKSSFMILVFGSFFCPCEERRRFRAKMSHLTSSRRTHITLLETALLLLLLLLLPS